MWRVKLTYPRNKGNQRKTMKKKSPKPKTANHVPVKIPPKPAKLTPVQRLRQRLRDAKAKAKEKLAKLRETGRGRLKRLRDRTKIQITLLKAKVKHYKSMYRSEVTGGAIRVSERRLKAIDRAIRTLNKVR
jgi:hypothetical protein